MKSTILRPPAVCPSQPSLELPWCRPCMSPTKPPVQPRTARLSPLIWHDFLGTSPRYMISICVYIYIYQWCIYIYTSLVFVLYMSIETSVDLAMSQNPSFFYCWRLPIQSSNTRCNFNATTFTDSDTIVQILEPLHMASTFLKSHTKKTCRVSENFMGFSAISKYEVLVLEDCLLYKHSTRSISQSYLVNSELSLCVTRSNRSKTTFIKHIFPETSNNSTFFCPWFFLGCL
jgi:hypothetical protein